MPRLYKETRAVLNKFLTVDLGLLGYRQAYALQKRVVAARKAGAIEDVLLLCEHAHVITLGRNGKLENLLSSMPRIAVATLPTTGRDRLWDIRS